MPDLRSHRGPHPEDARLFAPQLQPALRKATADLCWLLGRGYAQKSALKLVGDRYDLVARGRTAVGRCACGDAQAARRKQRMVEADGVGGRPLWLDGYNVLTTVEAALAGGVVLAARDGAYRDMASMHGSYRKVAETRPALELLGNVTASLGVAECLWFLDRPVSNSGRLKGIMQEVAAAGGWRWRVELVRDPDAVLMDPGYFSCPGSTAPNLELLKLPVVATADSAILDRCGAWFNLARETVVRHVPTAWVVELGV